MLENLSFWEKDVYFDNVDVTIIGSGIVGLSTALNLKLRAPHLKVLILERGILPNGASTKNAGFTCFGSPSEILADLKHNSPEKVFSLVKKRWEGLKRLRKIVGDANMNFQQLGGYEIFADDVSFAACADQLTYLNQQLQPIIEKENVFSICDEKIKAYGFKSVKHMIVNHAEGQIHTGNMMLALTRKAQELGVLILNNIEVKEFSAHAAGVEIMTTNHFTFTTRKLLLAVNGFARQFLVDFPLVPGRAQVVLTSPIADLNFSGTFHFDEGYYFFRNVGTRVLLGGGRNLDFQGEETCEFGLTPKIQNRLVDILKNQILPDKNFTIEQRWSGIMGLTNNQDKTFIIKKLQENTYCALRMGGMGIAVGSLVGEEAAELLLN